ncbi:MAG: hypothetical protein GAK37_01514 [Pseudomonas sp.]|nr:MAG: hypothetical protein GAK37_01514 [Pseudomonas sp.]
MLINNNTQAAATIQQLKRADMDPANAAASALYSGAAQAAAQQPVTVPTVQTQLDQANDRIDEAFAKTRVQLQASAQAPAASTDVPASSPLAGTDSPNSSSAAGSARADFTDYMHKSPAERIRDQILKEKGLTEADYEKMTPAQQDALNKEVADRLKTQQDQQVAAKSAPDQQAQTVKETLAAI